VPTALVNPAWTYLRGFLQPGKGRNVSAPLEVSDGLVAVVDSEDWVPIPRYSAGVTASAPGAGRHNFIEIRGHPKFCLTNLRILPAASFSLYLVTSNNGGAADLDSGTFTQASTTVQVWSGDRSQAEIGSGNTGTQPPGGSSVLNANIWQELPDISPGSVIQITHFNANTSLRVNLQWAERRPLGVN